MTGCSVISRSTSSPKNSIRTGCSSYTGNTSTVSPRTRNVPRLKSTSLRSYWISTNSRSSSSRSTSSPTPQADHRSTYSCGRAQTVDARHGRHHDHVAAGRAGCWSRVPQPLDLLVDRGVLLDEGVRLRDVRLGLVVVVVARRSTRPRCPAAARGTRWPAARPASCSAPSPASAAAAARPARPSSPILPVPVAPSSTTSCSPAWIRARDLVDRRGLVAGGLELADHPERGDRALQVGDGSGHAGRGWYWVGPDIGSPATPPPEPGTPRAAARPPTLGTSQSLAVRLVCGDA